jgi:hypothetical protein
VIDELHELVGLEPDIEALAHIGVAGRQPNLHTTRRQV